MYEIFNGKKASCELENELFKSINSKTPNYIKENCLIDLNNKEAFTFGLKREHLLPYDKDTNPQGLGLASWLETYAKEAEVSTAGIRGPQNILYPHDTRFPINLIGVMLATHAKALAAKKLYPGCELVKIASGEVRYNTDKYLELIARIQAAEGIKTLVPKNRKSTPIWLASFLAFKLDLLGGEYITSSHGISVKNATKDLNSQGSQYLPEESLLFVNQIKEIFKTVQDKGGYEIKIAADKDKLIDEDYMAKIENGIVLYQEYLKNGVGKQVNIDLIKEMKNNVIIENVGGCAYNTLSKLLEKFEIAEKFEWLNKEEDPFFHSIGKYDTDPKGNKCFYDYSVDATVICKDQNGKSYFPIIKSLNYDKKLADKPVGTAVLITDPDHDRLTVCQIECKSNRDLLIKLGVDFIELTENKILSIYTANQAFLMIMDFWTKQLRAEGTFDHSPKFLIKTTASAKAWDEWAKSNSIKVINVPVGFKEIANIMKKVEKKIKESPDKEVVITDVLGNDINIGKNPRLIFGGEESGGMILGAEELITSANGRLAIAMREKSATEAIFVASALASHLEQKKSTMSQYLNEIFEENKIIAKFDIREDISYYNESEPDIEKLKRSKLAGEALRTKNDLFYLTIAIAFQNKTITLDTVKQILSTTFEKLNFENLLDIKFVGDGTYFDFTDKFIEIRPSGTDAKTKAYGAGESKENIQKFAKIMGNYDGERNEIYLKNIGNDLYESSKDKSMEYYKFFTDKDANNETFMIPQYAF